MPYQYKLPQYDDSASKLLEKPSNVVLEIAGVLTVGAIALVGTLGNARSTTLFTSSDSSTANTINYSSKRSNYDVVPYFDSAYNSVLKYAHLKSFRGILEP